ncbi:MAG: ribose-phosphate pyrophosphokinase [Deltaproteobacteria bacterium]|nr:ribose-phosphate pyrophosphokinase [Deltaproteobacteria bacterium]
MSAFEVLCGTAHPELGEAVARELGRAPLGRSIERTPDGELLVRVDESVRGRAIAVVQPTHAPVGDHLIELLLIGDACVRAGARTVVAVVPYLGYGRQDRRAAPGDALGARVFGAALGAVRFGRVLVVDPHDPGVEAGFSCPVDSLSAMTTLTEALEPIDHEKSVVVAPDLGAAKLAERVAHRLRLPFAIVHKRRMSPVEARAGRIVGEVRGLRPILVDDIISTAGTIASAIERLLDEGAAEPITVVATHGLFADPAAARLAALPIARVITTDTVPRPAQPSFVHASVSIAPLLAEAILRLGAGGALEV